MIMQMENQIAASGIAPASNQAHVKRMLCFWQFLSVARVMSSPETVDEERKVAARRGTERRRVLSENMLAVL